LVVDVILVLLVFVIIRSKIMMIFKLGVAYITGTCSLIDELLDAVGSFDIWWTEGITSRLCNFDKLKTS